MRRRILLPAVLLAVLAGVAAIAWTAAGWPPVRFLLRYGLSPYCEPTGRKVEVEGLTFVEISPGIFRMGSTYGAGGDALGRLCARVGLPWGDQPKMTTEMPVHWVEFREGYWISKYEVTNAQYEQYDPEHDRWAPEDDHPVTWVHGEEARSYGAWLAERSGVPVRLPSEAEWECACRAGSRADYCYGNEVDRLQAHAWYGWISMNGPRPMGGLEPNAWGLHDLHGNVIEWCEDRYHDSYGGAPADGSAWTEGGGDRPSRRDAVVRSGAWGSPAEGCRSASRGRNYPTQRYFSLGFRPAFSIRTDEEREALERLLREEAEGE